MAEKKGLIDESKSSNDNVPNSSSVDSVDVGKQRKSVRPRSLVWKHFEKYEDSNETPRAKCNYLVQVMLPIQF